MPKDSRVRKYAKRYRPYQRKKYRRSMVRTPNNSSASLPGLSVPRGINGFPMEIRTTLKYCDSIQLNSASAAIDKYVFRMNSLFDPDLTGTGHQPYYFDQYAAIYSRYCVIGSKLTAEFSAVPEEINHAAISVLNGPIVCCVWGDPTSTNTSTLSTALEVNTSQSRLISGGNGGNNTCTLSTTYSPETKLGLSNGDDTVTAGVTGNPSQVWYGVVAVADTGVSIDTDVIVKITMEFRVRFFQLTDVTGS